MEFEKYSIEYLKSGLSINTHIGCNLGCSYCILTTSLNQFPRQPFYIKSPQSLVDAIIGSNALFVNGLTPIYINNRTDPFLPSVMESSYEVLRILSAHHIESPIIFISKLSPDCKFADMIKNMNVIYFYTYSGLIGMDYNSRNSVNQRMLKLIEQNVPFKNRYHYFRPIIPGYNDSVETINKVIKMVKNTFYMTVAGGIRINKENSIQFSISDYDKNHKLFSDTVWKVIKETAQSMDYPLVRHTSCAIAQYMKQPNKLRYIEMKQHCLQQKCPNYSICKIGMNADHHLVEGEIAKRTDAHYRWDEFENLIFDDAVEQELLAFLRSTYGINTIASKIILSPSEQKITE